MGILQNLFGPKRPTLRKSDISNIERVDEFVLWFIKNDPIVKGISNPSSNIIFEEGYRPKSGTLNNPESFADVNTLTEWFVIKVFIDLNMLKDATKDEFKQFIDILDESSTETLSVTMEIAMKYSVNFESFIYGREIQKIPTGTEREWFKVNFLGDNVLSAEIRILAWLYHEYFGEWYKIKKIKDE
jgi:hypothetical protein